ncbi:MAG: M48 family metallopeptidase [Deltaproteobacteria bacterium]|nr:M48 family metallopeptidase [Deltaproteobacteria bacterium]
MRRPHPIHLALAAFTMVFLLGASPCGTMGSQIRNNIQQAERNLRINSAQDIRRVGQRITSATKHLDAALQKHLPALKKGLDHPAATELTPEQEYYLGRTVCAQILAERFENRVVAVKGKGREATGSADLHYLQAIANALVPAAERSHLDALPPERIPTALRVAVVPGDAPNAYATPGGFVVVTSGMLSLAENEDELAAVLAHELSHVTLAHGLSAIDKAEAPLLKRIGRGAEALGTSMGVDLSELTQAFDKFTGAISAKLTKGYDADYEFAADARAASILEEAGYDPSALPRIVDRLGSWLEANGQKGFGETHPSPKDRLARLGEVPVVPGAEGHQRVREVRFAAHTPKLVQQGAQLASR